MGCKICGNEEGNKEYTIKEMMFGSRESFTYIKCGQCGCLQIKDKPADMSRYYPKEYYAYKSEEYGLKTLRDTALKRFVRSRRTFYFMFQKDLIGALVSTVKPVSSPLSKYLTWMKKCNARRNSSILDVGCGHGRLIFELYWYGFNDLMGVDPYIEREIEYPNGVKVLKSDLSTFERSFDVIMLHHSLEHMDEPLLVLQRIGKLLNKDGRILIRLPVVSSYAWQHYGVHWVQLDAPRHFFLFSLTSFELLAKQAGLSIEETVFDSSEFQFFGSEQNSKDIPLLDQRSYAVNPRSSIFSEEDMQAFREKAARLNEEKKGDQVCMYLKKQ